MFTDEYARLGRDRKQARGAATLAYLLLPLGGFLSLAIVIVGLFTLNTGLHSQMRTASRLSHIANSLPGLVGQLDRDLRFRFANATYETWFGQKVENIVGRPSADVMGAEAAKRAKPQLQKALSGERQDYEERITTSAGEELFLQVALLPDFGLGGTDVQGVFLVALDVSARRRAEDEVRRANAELERRVALRTGQLEAANKELEAFSYSVSHDLRAPFGTSTDLPTCSRSNAQEDSTPTSAALPRKRSRSSAKRMGTLIDDLLSFSRMGRAEMQPTDRVDLQALTEEVIIALEPETMGRHIVWKVSALPPCDGRRGAFCVK